MATKTTKKPAAKATKSNAKETANHAAETASSAAETVKSGTTFVRNRMLDGQKRLLDFQRSSFDRTFDAVVSFAEKREDELGDWMKKNERLPEELKDTYATWVWASRTGRASYREAVIKTFDLAEQWTESRRSA